MVKKNYYVGQVFKELNPSGVNRYYKIIKLTPIYIHVRGNFSNKAITWWTYKDVDRWLGNRVNGLQDVSFSKYLEAL